jgi:hypothetical protein
MKVSAQKVNLQLSMQVILAWYILFVGCLAGGWLCINKIEYCNEIDLHGGLLHY